jgi:hypothetical protein
MNARFWHYVNGGLVKITIKPGQELSHSTSEQHDEGYSFQAASWRYDGAHVQRECTGGGKDCDGFISYSYDAICSVDKLHTDWNKYSEVYYPTWQNTDARQYDQYAEMMNY